MTEETDIAEVYQICAEHQIEITDLAAITGSFNKRIYFINQRFLLRMSETSMTLKQEKFRLVASLNFVPKIIHTGTLSQTIEPIYYTLLTLLPGDDFVNAYPGTTESQQEKLGGDVAGFLDRLHELDGTHYDIGLYVPMIAQFSGTWREGHQEYWKLLKQESEKLQLKSESIQIFERAYRFLEETSGSLDYQAGPRLLHNDFHPRNILLNRGTFSGVIDWECSQFGEADFELCHLIHWTLYPPESSIDFRTFLKALFKASPKCTQAPNLAQRLTIYQIEHEIQQIIWQPGVAEALRVPRLIRWMGGYIEELFRSLDLNFT